MTVPQIQYSQLKICTKAVQSERNLTNASLVNWSVVAVHSVGHQGLLTSATYNFYPREYIKDLMYKKKNGNTVEPILSGLMTCCRPSDNKKSRIIEVDPKTTC
jgi:hypothetical protein